MKVGVIGFGSIGSLHTNLLIKNNKVDQILIITKQKLNIKSKKVKISKKIDDLILFNPSVFFICSETSKHISQMKYINKKFKKKKILVEKPVFLKNEKFTEINKNSFFINYTLRYHPIVKFIKEISKKDHFFYAEFYTSSFIPNWRKNIPYFKSYSAQKKFGGGVTHELSHELDIALKIFGSLDIINSFNKKISNLKMNADDILLSNFKTKKGLHINFCFNLFSKFESRKIKLIGKKFQINADLKNFIIEKISKNKILKIKFKKLNRFGLNQKMHDDFFKSNKNTCSLNDAKLVINYITKILKKK